MDVWVDPHASSLVCIVYEFMTHHCKQLLLLVHESLCFELEHKINVILMCLTEQ